MAIERMAECENIAALAKELGVPPRTLYNWRNRFVARDGPLNRIDVS